MVNRIHDTALEFLAFYLMSRPEIERDDDPQQPPQRFRHQRDSLHPLRKPQGRDHGRHEQAQRAKRQRGTRQTVDPVHEPVKPALGPRAEFRAVLVHRLPACRSSARGPRLCIFAKHLDGFPHDVAIAPKDNAKDTFNQPHAATLF